MIGLVGDQPCKINLKNSVLACSVLISSSSIHIIIIIIIMRMETDTADALGTFLGGANICTADHLRILLHFS
jgi:hypothetical protein